MTGVTLYPFVTTTSGAPALSSRSSRHRGRCRGVLHFRNIPVAAVARYQRARRRKPISPLAKKASIACRRRRPRRCRPQCRTRRPKSARTSRSAAARYAPLGGAGAPPRRFARHLPIERDGGTHFLAVEQVVAVHANAHYTYVFDGNDKLFCPLAIGDVESRLDGSQFIRVHRSHIVNIGRVVGYKRSGDSELVEMAGAHNYLVPVSRSRIGSLKSRVATLNGADPAMRRAGGIVLQCNKSRSGLPNASITLTQFVQSDRHSCGCNPFGAFARRWCSDGCCCSAQLATTLVLRRYCAHSERDLGDDLGQADCAKGGCP